MPVMTRVEFSILWLVGLVYYFVTSPAGMTPLPVAAGWIILGTTIGLAHRARQALPDVRLVPTHDDQQSHEWWPSSALVNGP